MITFSRNFKKLYAQTSECKNEKKFPRALLKILLSLEVVENRVEIRTSFLNDKNEMTAFYECLVDSCESKA